MHTQSRPFTRQSLLMTLALSALITGPSRADDSEIFINTRAVSPPNVLLVLDTSGSMGSTVSARLPYNGATTYTGACVAGNAYIADPASGGAAPACTVGSFPIASMGNCPTGTAALSGAGSPGYYTDSMVRWTRTGTSTYTYAWSYSLTGASAADVACKSANLPGTQVPTLYAGPVNSASVEWTPYIDPAVGAPNSYWAAAGTPKPLYTLFSGNYLNWLYLKNPPLVNIGSRIQVVTKAATNLINSVPTSWNFGLMRYSSNGTGGMVADPIAPLSTNQASLTSTLASYSAGGSTPLSETLYEAYLYYAGLPVYYGLKSTPFASVASSRNGNVYKSPITDSCQKNFVIFLTDGQPNVDTAGNSLMAALDTKKSGGCDNPAKYPYSHSITPNLGSSYATDGICAGAVSQFMYQSDMSPLAGIQNVQTYFIGFGSDFNNPSNASLQAEVDYLASVSARGGGKSYTAADLTSLEAVFTTIASNIAQQSNSLVAPTVPVNSFNPTQSLNDVYLSLFDASTTWHWPGNLKKYQVQNGLFVDANGVSAVDPSTQTLRASAQSVWSKVPDGATVTSGGAASLLPSWDPASAPPRNMYTYTGAANPGAPVDLTSSPQYQFVVANTAISAAALGAAGAADSVRADIINYARGEDLKNINANGLTTDARLTMGDAMHASPGVVIYGGAVGAANIEDGVIYRPDNDGMLHAISTATGVELWAFIPQAALGQMQSLYSDPPLATKHYVLDGSVRVLSYDINGDGVIDASAGDRVLIFFGQGRGGPNYYAMDVTDRFHPKFLWSIDDTILPSHGQAWGTPVVARLDIKGSVQNSQKFALVISGGYDPVEDNASYRAADSVGNAVYIVDALYGTLLWSAGNSGADLNLARMDHAIPSDVLVLDTNGDGFADRLYVGDMAGQLWRFDITNGNPRGTLVAGGVIASLGAHDGSATTNNRRFYNVPDASLYGTPGYAPFYNIAIGSGYRGHPLDATTVDYFFSFRDYNAYNQQSQTYYNNLTPAVVSQMVDITSHPTDASVPDGSPGWKLAFASSGEKILAPSVTFGGTILFTSYTPTGALTACAPSVGINRLYEVGIADGRPVANLNQTNNASALDRVKALVQGGIAPTPTIAVSMVSAAVANSDNSNTANGLPCTGAGCTQNNPTLCAVQWEGCTIPPFGSRVKTYWNSNEAQ